MLVFVIKPIFWRPCLNDYLKGMTVGWKLILSRTSESKRYVNRAMIDYDSNYFNKDNNGGTWWWLKIEMILATTTTKMISAKFTTAVLPREPSCIYLHKRRLLHQQGIEKYGTLKSRRSQFTARKKLFCEDIEYALDMNKDYFRVRLVVSSKMAWVISRAVIVLKALLPFFSKGGMCTDELGEFIEDLVERKHCRFTL